MMNKSKTGRKFTVECFRFISSEDAGKVSATVGYSVFKFLKAFKILNLYE